MVPKSATIHVQCRPLLNEAKAIVGHVWHILSASEDPAEGFARFWLHENFSDQLKQGKHFIVLPQSWQVESLLANIEQANDLVICVGPHDNHNPALLHLAKAARLKGAELALIDFDASDDAWQLLSVVQYVKLAIKQTSAESVTRLKQANITLVASGVADEGDFQQAKQAGCRWFEGYFFTQPLLTGSNDKVNKASLLRVLAQLNDPNVALHHLAEVIGQDVTLTLQLMTALNSAAMALPQPVHSLFDAVQFLGTKRLSFWVSVLMLSQMKDAPPVLLYTALARARFLETLAEMGVNKNKKDAWFLMGLFSTLDAFLHLPMVEALEGIPLADDIVDALVRGIGDMGHALALALTLEGVGATVDLNFEALDVCSLSMLYVESTSWAYGVWSQ